MSTTGTIDPGSVRCYGVGCTLSFVPSSDASQAAQVLCSRCRGGATRVEDSNGLLLGYAKPRRITYVRKVVE